MANSSTSQGQLQRAGVKRLAASKHSKKKFMKHMLASRKIHESVSGTFTEKGQDEKAKSGAPKSRVYLVTIIEEGLGNSKDKNYYSAEALQSGPNVFNGAKAFCDHPDAISEKTLPERSMRDVVGWYTDCFTDKNPQTGKVRLRGKLHIFPDAKWLSDKIDTILTDPSAKNLFGISINAIGKTRPATMQGEEVNYVEEFQRVDSADVVTEPAARGKFDQMLESRRSSKSKVSVSMSGRTRRTREAAALSSEKAKEVADSLVSAYNSDNPDEAKQAMFEAAKVLHAASSISGKGPGQSNEEQYSNINPSGGAEDMSQKTKVKASAGRRPLGFRKKKALKAAAGTGPDNEDEGEPDPGDIEPQLESRRRSSREADVEDEEHDTDLGAQDDFGGGSKYRSKEARARAEEAFEDEGLEDEGMEDEDEAFEDEGLEDEDENVGQAPGGAASPGAAPAAPMGGGAPGSSRSVASAEADDGESDDGESESDDDDLDDMDEAAEDEHDMMRPGSISESRRRRSSREAGASFSGGLGKAGHSALPKGVDETKGYTDRDEDFGKEDDSTSGVGKSYKIKTSRFARNRKARRIVKPVVREANRRIDHLTNKIRRLAESNRSKDRKIEHYRGKFRLMESGRTATTLLREAVHKEILPDGVARDLYRELLGLNRDDQIRKIKSTARFLESAQEGVVSRLTESVDGNGARGSVVSWGTAGADDSELIEGLAGDGVPMREDQ